MITISVAGLPIGLDNRFPYLAEHCRDYLTDRPAEFTVSVTDDEIRQERAASAETGLTFSDGYLESIVSYRKIAERLPAYRACVFHGAVLELDGNAYAFAAKSGTGKTTHIRLWQQVFGDRVRILNGDKPILRLTDGRIYVCGTPWRGKECYGENRMTPLRAIAFLERADTDRAEPLSPALAVAPLLSQCYMPHTPQAVAKTLELADTVLRSVHPFRLFCTMDENAARVAARAMCAPEAD